jgi:integrase
MTKTYPQSLSISLSNFQKIDMDVEVTIESYRGKLRLRIPAKIFGTYKYIYTRRPDTEEGRTQARRQALLIEEDIANGQLDTSLEKYRPRKEQTYLSVVEEANKPIPALKFEDLKRKLDTGEPIFGFEKRNPALPELWQRYVKYRSFQVSETTLRLNYTRISSHLDKCPYKSLNKAIEIRYYLVRKTSPYTAKRVLTQLNACCNWAVESKLIDKNPFIGMAGKIKTPDKAQENIDPFTKHEREAIIKGFEDHPVYNHYANFVKFLFMTGCRSSEAVGLKWKHIDSSFNFITFSEAVVNASGEKIRKDNKTHRIRKFPCNSELQELLRSIKPAKVTGEDLVFTSLTGDEINIHTFNARCWKGCMERGVCKEGIVSKLVREGLVERYRPQYQTRHTFITICVEAGIPPARVAEWVGNTPEIIMRCYCGTLKHVQVPNI